uniref:Uncharacterized protein n=1 Tax=Aegilops tauschii subsp. strangulata TaxID=200361 RepID=A0A453KSM2_AEGTS
RQWPTVLLAPIQIPRRPPRGGGGGWRPWRRRGRGSSLRGGEGLGGGGRLRGAAGAMGLQKQNSWSPDIELDEAWERRRRGILGRSRRSPLQHAQSVTNDQLDELRGSFDLGFRFNPPSQRCAACDAGRSRLVETLPALDLLYAIAANTNAGAASQCSCGTSSEASELSPIGSPLSILSPSVQMTRRRR